MSRYGRATGRSRGLPSPGYLVLVLAGTWCLAACGGSEEPAQEPTSAPQAEQATPAQQGAQDAARKREQQQRVEEAKREAARMRIESEGNLPAPDENLNGLLAELDRSVAQAESAVEGNAGADGQLQQAERLRRQAAERLAELKSIEEQKRQGLRERYSAAAAQGGSLPPDLLMGLDSDVYLVYKQSVVERLQQALKDQGLYGASVNGDLDEETMVSLGLFQQTHLLRASGVPSPRTRKTLFADQ